MEEIKKGEEERERERERREREEERRGDKGENLLFGDPDSTLQPAGEHSLPPSPSKDLCLQHHLTNT